MTSQSPTLSLEQFALVPAWTRRQPAFRIVMMPGEVLRVPGRCRTLRVISGSPWVTQDGVDHTPQTGATLALDGARNGALVSAERGTLLLEIA